MHRADARAGQHGEGGLGDHRHVDGDAIALGDALPLQHVGEAAHLGVQLAIGDEAGILRVVAFPDDGDLVALVGEVAVDAVHRRIGGAVAEPRDGHGPRREGGVLDAVVGLHPVDPHAVLAPERLRVLHRAGIHLPVSVRADQRRLLERLRHIVNVLGHRLPPRPCRLVASGLSGPHARKLTKWDAPSQGRGAPKAFALPNRQEQSLATRSSAGPTPFSE